MSAHLHPAPIRRPVWTPGVWVLVGFVIPGFAVAAYRFLFGLQAVTNLDQAHPWGLWIAIDVATGVALAAGGFTTAAIAHVFWRKQYQAIARPALLAALLGYTFYTLGLLVDLGRYYNVWHPILPTMWQGNSVLFEVGMCVLAYLTVLYIEFAPVVCERFADNLRFPRLSRLSRLLLGLLKPTMFVFIIAGVVLSCLHQSSLGTLMLVAPSKMHPLWYTPVLPLLFLFSAIAVGFPVVIVQSLYASWSFRLAPEIGILGGLARLTSGLLGVYLAMKIGDLVIRGSYVHLTRMSIPTLCFALETVAGVVVPMLLLASPRARRSGTGLFVSALLVVLGVALNRVNVFLVAYEPPYATRSYFPSWGEFAVTLALISGLILVYRILVTLLPVISHRREAPAS